MHFNSINMTFVALLDRSKVVRFHSQPVIIGFVDFLYYCMPNGMGAKRSFVNFFDEHVFLVYIHAYEHNHVMISFVEHLTI